MTIVVKTGVNSFLVRGDLEVCKGKGRGTWLGEGGPFCCVPHKPLLSPPPAELPRCSAVRLASLHDLPTQLLELYQQGFSLVALHPFVQPTHEREKTPLEHIFRAILIKKTDR